MLINQLVCVCMYACYMHAMCCALLKSIDEELPAALSAYVTVRVSNLHCEHMCGTKKKLLHLKCRPMIPDCENKKQQH